MIAGPGVAGTAIASGDLLGIDVDDLPFIGGGDDSRGSHSSVQPGAAGGAGGGTHRSSKLPPVPKEPVSRTVTIHEPDAAGNSDAGSPESGANPSAGAPAVLAAPLAVPPVPPPAGPAPAAAAPAPPAAPVIAPQPSAPADQVPSDSLGLRPPIEARIGYADYLRTATVAGLLAVALPGAAGLVAATAAGAFVGYRQALAAQTLPPSNVARFLA
ncbi:hypothetical protein A5662_04995 [Mycobacteriaceae bacterium 1482268.1]|nr:hypothetical protein A5662_04995 [Mycobacteriaceae bacterium 1482268.1]